MTRRQADPPVPVPEPEPEWLVQAEHRRLRVHTVRGESIEGILRLAAQDGLLLWGAQMIVEGKAVKLDGEVFVPRGQVLFVQTVRM